MNIQWGVDKCKPLKIKILVSASSFRKKLSVPGAVHFQKAKLLQILKGKEKGT